MRLFRFGAVVFLFGMILASANDATSQTPGDCMGKADPTNYQQNCLFFDKETEFRKCCDREICQDFSDTECTTGTVRYVTWTSSIWVGICKAKDPPYSGCTLCNPGANGAALLCCTGLEYFNKDGDTCQDVCTGRIALMYTTIAACSGGVN
jgi:hypothetical protein